VDQDASAYAVGERGPYSFEHVEIDRRVSDHTATITVQQSLYYIEA
jgi:hypothetical protein